MPMNEGLKATLREFGKSLNDKDDAAGIEEFIKRSDQFEAFMEKFKDDPWWSAKSDKEKIEFNVWISVILTLHHRK